MTRDELEAEVCRAIEAAARNPLPDPIAPEHSFLLDLGFDSLSISELMIELRHTLGQPIWLVDWIERAGDPLDLTVEALCDYVEELLEQHG